MFKDKSKCQHKVLVKIKNRHHNDLYKCKYCPTIFRIRNVINGKFTAPNGMEFGLSHGKKGLLKRKK